MMMAYEYLKTTLLTPQQKLYEIQEGEYAKKVVLNDSKARQIESDMQRK